MVIQSPMYPLIKQLHVGRLVSSKQLATIEGIAYPTMQPSRLATENNPTIEALKLYGGDERTSDDVPLVRRAHTTVQPYAKPEVKRVNSCFPRKVLIRGQVF